MNFYTFKTRGIKRHVFKDNFEVNIYYIKICLLYGVRLRLQVELTFNLGQYKDKNYYYHSFKTRLESQL
jgi:hypothetical protein